VEENYTQQIVVRYLLGLMPRIEHARFEAYLYADDRLLEELEAAEDDLIDDYLNGDLSRDYRVAFETYYLRSPESLRRLGFGMSLKAYLSSSKATEPQDVQRRDHSLWRTMIPLFCKRLLALSIRPKPRE
jgi:hypothetical protein